MIGNDAEIDTFPKGCRLRGAKSQGLSPGFMKRPRKGIELSNLDSQTWAALLTGIQEANCQRA